MYRLYCILSAVSIIMINQKQNKGKQNIGSFLLLPAYGRVGQGQHFLAAYFAKRNTKFGGGGNYQNSASGFSRKKVRILFRTDSQFVKFVFPASPSPSARASADEFSSNFQTSQSFFRPKGERKAAIFLPKNDYKYNQIKI